jgi:hypothetical protein
MKMCTMMRKALFGGIAILSLASAAVWLGCSASGSTDVDPGTGGGGSTQDSGKESAAGSAGSGGSAGAAGHAGTGGGAGSAGDAGTAGSDGGLTDATPDSATDASLDSSTDGSADDASIDGSPDAPTDAQPDTACASGCPAGTWDIDGNPLTGQCGCEYTCTKTSQDDPIDPDYTDANCDGTDGVAERCVYVASNGNDTNPGSRQSPVQTIAYAIQLADTLGNGTAVCLAGEKFSGFVAIKSGISIYGGFDQNDPDFAFRRSNKVTTTLESQGTVLEALKIDGDTHIEGLTIHAVKPSDLGSSSYGVRLADGLGTLYVRYNVINSDDGVDGADGANAAAPGDDGTNGTKGDDGTKSGSSGGSGGPTTTSACGTPGGKGGDGGYGSAAGTNGADGSQGAKGGPGSSSSACFGGGHTAGDGESVTAMGGPGTPGGQCDALGTMSSTAFYAPPKAPAGTEGKPGGSGGGGGAAAAGTR